MSQYSIIESSCNEIFRQTETEMDTAASAHRAMSTAIDDARSALSDPKVSDLSTALAAIYNRVLTSALTAGEQQVRSACAGGRGAVGAFRDGAGHMADDTRRRQMESSIDQFEVQAHDVDDVTITDGKR